MNDYEQEDPIPQGDLALQITALPRETNGFGDIYGGWLVAQMDLAGTAMASRVAGGRVATVSIDRMAFMVPVAVGAQLSFYTQTLEVGRSSIRMLVEVWSDDPVSSEWRKVTEAVFVFVAIDAAAAPAGGPAPLSACPPPRELERQRWRAADRGQAPRRLRARGMAAKMP